MNNFFNYHLTAKFWTSPFLSSRSLSKVLTILSSCNYLLSVKIRTLEWVNLLFSRFHRPIWSNHFATRPSNRLWPWNGNPYRPMSSWKSEITNLSSNFNRDRSSTKETDLFEKSRQICYLILVSHFARKVVFEWTR